MPAIPCHDIQRLFAQFEGTEFVAACEGVSRADFADHLAQCERCRDALYGYRARSWGVDPQAYPCVHMAYRANQMCAMHPDRAECPDLFIAHNPATDTYTLIKDGVSVPIAFCPWCGVRLTPRPHPADGTA